MNDEPLSSVIPLGFRTQCFDDSNPNGEILERTVVIKSENLEWWGHGTSKRPSIHLVRISIGKTNLRLIDARGTGPGDGIT
jgi:hypothetical protein